MNTKKILIGAAVVATMLVGVSSWALAENNGQNTESMKINNGKEMALRAGTQMVLQVGGNGNVLLRGTVNTVGANSLTVKSWLGDLTVNILSTTQLAPGKDIGQIHAGDFVGVSGNVDTSTPWTVNADVVRDWTARKLVQENKQVMRTERHNNEQEIKDVIKNESPKNFQGVATNINVAGNSFTFTMDGVAYTVTLVTNAQIVDQRFLSTSLASVKEGDTVRVWGPVTGTTINAYVFRDVSLIATYDLKALKK